MAVPLPLADQVDLRPPSADEAATLARGIAAAVAGPAGLTELQRLLVSAITQSMTGFAVRVADGDHVDAEPFAQYLARRDLAFRTRIVQIMILSELVLSPLPPTVAARVRSFAAELSVDDDVISIAESYAAGALDVAASDFARNGYLSSIDPSRLRAVHAQALGQAWAAVDADPRLAAQWQSLEQLPANTLGRAVTDFYRDRGFVYPGMPGSAPPLLAQHDWVHVLAGYGTSLENELEVFAFMARANDDPRAFSLLAMVVSLFETGYLAAGAGLFEANPGHLRAQGMTSRLADAMRRGAVLRGSHDFLDLDWFAIADRPVSVVRAEIGVTRKNLPPDAVSPSAWEIGGITQFQMAAARRQAEVADVEYLPWRPDPERS